MITTLFVLVSHALFDWSCRKSPADLVSNFGEIVKESFGFQPDLSTSLPLYKGATRLYDLTRKKKNFKQSKNRVIKNEEVLLKSYEIDLGSVTVKDNQDIQKNLDNKSKRKNFDELTSRSSKRVRVMNVVGMLESDSGLEEKVLEKLETRKGEVKSEEDFDLSCLALIKTLGISNHKYDDLRFWVQDMLRREKDLSLMPTSRQLMEKVKAEMVPPNMTSSETGASIPVVDAVHHQGGRIVLRFFNCHLSLSFYLHSKGLM